MYESEGERHVSRPRKSGFVLKDEGTESILNTTHIQDELYWPVNVAKQKELTPCCLE
jgi:hypothetical protein